MIVAVGAEEADPRQHPEATTSSAALLQGVDGLAGVRTLLVADDGSNGWPTVSTVELGVAAGCRVVVLTPASGFAAAIPAEARVQLLQRLTSADIEIHP